MSSHFALNEFSEKQSAPTSEQAGPLNIHISSWPAGIRRDFSQAFRGIFFFFGLCAWTHMTEQLTRLSQPPSNGAENSGQRRSWKKRGRIQTEEKENGTYAHASAGVQQESRHADALEASVIIDAQSVEADVPD